MVSVKDSTSAFSGSIPQIVIGTVVALIVAIITALIGPIFILNEYLKPASVHIIAIITQWIGALICALIVIMSDSERRLLPVTISTGVFYLVLVCCGALFFGCDFERAIIGLLSNAVGAICAFFLANRKRKTQKRKRLKHRSR